MAEVCPTGEVSHQRPRNTGVWGGNEVLQLAFRDGAPNKKDRSEGFIRDSSSGLAFFATDRETFGFRTDDLSHPILLLLSSGGYSPVPVRYSRFLWAVRETRGARGYRTVLVGSSGVGSFKPCSPDGHPG